MREILACGALLCACVVGAWVIQSRPPQAQFHTIDGTAFRAVYLVQDDDAKQASIHLIVQAGEMDNDGPEGQAHYLEHLAWIDAFQSSGERADRHANAWTDAESTVYRESFTPAASGRAVARAQSVLDRPTLDKTFAQEERGIVQREFDMRMRENPVTDILGDMAMTMYDQTPYARSVIGTPESIGQFSV